MKNVRKLVTAILIGVFSMSAIGCSMIQKTPEAIAKSTVAKVNGEKITRAELDKRMEPVIKNYETQYGEGYAAKAEYKDVVLEQKKQVLENMETEVLLMQKAKELNLIPEEKELDEEVTKNYDEIKEMYGGDEGLKGALENVGYTVEEFKAQIKDQVKLNKVVDYVIKDAEVTDEAAKEYYDSNLLEFTEKPNRVHLAHILVEKEETAKEIKEKLDKGEDFAKLAKEYGTDGTKDNGGDLGFIEYTDSNYDQTFMTAGIALKEGEISPPVNTQFGWHIIKSIKKEEYPVKSFEEVKEDIKANLLESEQSNLYYKTLDEWKEKAKIKEYENNIM